MENKQVKNYSDKETRTRAVNAVVKRTVKNLQDPDFIRKVADEFQQRKIAQFPILCAITRRDNLLKKKEFDAIDNSGGWSESRDFKFDYSIPRELYLFMTNLVARDFWDEENEKRWRWFMEQIMQGEDSTSLLYRMKQYYSGNDVSHKLIVR